MKIHSLRSALLALVALTAFDAPTRADLPYETVIHSFWAEKLPHDGHLPSTLIKASDGNFYGVTVYGGTTARPSNNAGDVNPGYGSFFRMTPAGVVTILHNFSDGTVVNDGQYPNPLLTIGGDGDFYGTTVQGGKAGDGTAYRMDTSGNITILRSFNDGTISGDGSGPNGGLWLAKDGYFYGTTQTGGDYTNSNPTEGTFFRMTSDGAVTILHSFATSTDGAEPLAGVIEATDGNFYGTTYKGGTNDLGLIYKMTSAGVETVIHSLASNYTEGGLPEARLVQGKNSALYGTTTTGGTYGGGTIFKATTGGVLTLLHSFVNPKDSNTVTDDGAYPDGGMILGADGNFYGGTDEGGTSAYPNFAGYGTIFKMTPTGTLTVLYNFVDGKTGTTEGADGNSVVESGGNFYGTTVYGGQANVGVAFEITSGGVYKVLHPFQEPVVSGDGANPQAALFRNSSGTLFGTTSAGGSTSPNGNPQSGKGTTFKITPAGAVTILHNFEDGSLTNDGTMPVEPVVLAQDGNYYGTTPAGGVQGNGTVFKMTPTGTLSILHSFEDINSVADGDQPLAGLTLDSSTGNLFGTTSYGFNSGGGEGTVYQITTGGSETVLHGFASGNDGRNSDGERPKGPVIKGKNGDFYGTTNTGGSAGDGVVFEMTPTGTVTVLHNFGDGTVTDDGLNPTAGLVLGKDGNFYGTTDYGGSSNLGSVFKMAPTGSVTILHSFAGPYANPQDGAYPNGSLIQLIDGNFCGTTTEGGVSEGNGLYGGGIVFEITSKGTMTVLYEFPENTLTYDGYFPYGSLVEDPTGVLFGTTSSGGEQVQGTVYTITKVAQSLNFANPGSHVTTDAPFKLSASASTGMTVTFSVVSGPAKVSGSTVTLTEQAGTVTIKAEQVGNPQYAPAFDTQSFTVTLASQTITFPFPGAQTYPGSVTLQATASSGLPVTYAVLSGPATVSGSTLTTTGTGTVTVQANQAGNGTYSAATPVSQKFKVTAAP